MLHERTRISLVNRARETGETSARSVLRTRPVGKAITAYTGSRITSPTAPERTPPVHKEWPTNQPYRQRT